MNTSRITRIFSEKWVGKAADYIKDPTKIKELLGKVTGFFGKEALADVLDDLKTLYAYVREVAMGEYKGYSIAKLSIAVGALIYLVSPIDVVPDFLPVIGLLDDATVIGFAVKQLKDEIKKYRMSKGL